MSDILEILKKEKNKLQQKYFVDSLALFGSYSRGDNKKNSDVDILVSFSKPVGMEFLYLANELEDLLGKKVDLVSKNAIKAPYYKFIEKDLKYV